MVAALATAFVISACYAKSKSAFSRAILARSLAVDKFKKRFTHNSK